MNCISLLTLINRILASKSEKYMPSMKVSHDNVVHIVSKFGEGNLKKMVNKGFSPDSLTDANCTKCKLPMNWRESGRIQPVNDSKGDFVRWRYASYHAGDCLSKGVNFNPENRHNTINVSILSLFLLLCF